MKWKRNDGSGRGLCASLLGSISIARHGQQAGITGKAARTLTIFPAGRSDPRCKASFRPVPLSRACILVSSVARHLSRLPTSHKARESDDPGPCVIALPPVGDPSPHRLLERLALTLWSFSFCDSVSGSSHSDSARPSSRRAVCQIAASRDLLRSRRRSHRCARWIRGLILRYPVGLAGTFHLSTPIQAEVDRSHCD